MKPIGQFDGNKRETYLPTRHISFLHLGDVHFPDLLATPPLADHKDRGMSAAMVGAVSSTRIVEIGREITRIRQEQVNLVAIAQTGDLTTRGDVPGYEACLKFLHNALQLSDSAYWGKSENCLWFRETTTSTAVKL